MKFRSILLAEARGSMAGATFSRNGNSAYVRARATPVNPRTPAQTVSRDSLNAVSTAWRALSQVIRTGWIDLAKTVPYVNSLGETAFYSGFQLFMKCNLTLRGIGAPTVDTAPAVLPTFGAISLSGLVAEQDASTFGDFSLNAQYVAQVANPTQLLVFEGTYPMSAGKAFVAKNAYRFFGTRAVNTPTGIFTMTDQFNAVYGLPATSFIGSRINVRARLVDITSGFASPYLELTAIVQEA